ncbi:MAG: agmatine deiminase family protein [Ignavibacteriaceae bacterium]
MAKLISKKNKKIQSLPSEAGFRIPAEWEKHEATWIGWPHNIEDWPGKITPIPWVYGEMVRKIAEGEIVRIIVENKDHEKSALKVLKAVDAVLDNVEFYRLKTDRGWTRDSGPAFIKNDSEAALVNFHFNAWAKYDNFKKDRKLPKFISKALGLQLFEALHNSREVTLEGGSIDINGKGTLITTEECLMDQKTQVRNPGFSKNDYETVFKNYLGITNVLWLDKGIAGDDTHGHVDDLCRFVNADTVVLVQEENTSDANYKALKENKERLQDAKLEDGSKLNVIDLPMPSPLYFKGERLPASYANFYIANSYVLVPTFNDVNDRKVLGILSELITDRPVIGIHAVDLVWGLGTLHCLTHEQPAV